MSGAALDALRAGLNTAVEPFLRAGPVGMAIAASLVLASLSSWSIFLARWRALRAAEGAGEGFLLALRGCGSLAEVEAEVGLAPLAPPAFAAAAALEELARPGPREGRAARAEAALAAGAAEARGRLETGIAWLGSTAVLAPFLGLLGTVVGILGAFGDIAARGDASLATVAGPISEALVATALGLAVAIPAAAGQHLLLRRLALVEVHLERSQHELLNLVRREAGARARHRIAAGLRAVAEAEAP